MAPWYDDKYRKEKLGSGSKGDVYRYQLPRTDIANQRILAVKEIKVANQTTLREASREAAIMHKLRHPQIVLFLGAHHVTTKHVLKLAMEKCHSWTEYAKHRRGLSRFVNSPGPKEEAMKSYTSQLLSSMDYLKIHQIVHRDIKTENILIKGRNFDPSNRILLGDFSSAIVCTNKNQTDLATATTAHFRAPELTMCSSPATYASDMFALGISFVEMATGRHPFEANNSKLSAHDRKRLYAMGAQLKFRGQELLPPCKDSNSVPAISLDEKPAVFTSDDFCIDFAKLIAALLNSTPEKRPTAEEARGFPLFHRETLAAGDQSIDDTYRVWNPRYKSQLANDEFDYISVESWVRGKAYAQFFPYWSIECTKCGRIYKRDAFLFHRCTSIANQPKPLKLLGGNKKIFNLFMSYGHSINNHVPLVTKNAIMCGKCKDPQLLTPLWQSSSRSYELYCVKSHANDDRHVESEPHNVRAGELVNVFDILVSHDEVELVNDIATRPLLRALTSTEKMAAPWCDDDINKSQPIADLPYDRELTDKDFTTAC